MTPHTIHLTYRLKGKKAEKSEIKEYTGRYTPEQSVFGRPHYLDLRKGDTLDFKCTQGPVYVEIDKKYKQYFSRKVFRSGEEPLKVIKPPQGKWKYCCGVVINDTTFGMPQHHKFGNTPDGKASWPPNP